ncbi:MAG TPA: hypothetical protein VFM05_13215, partial [Candidatus Saccharimonadales bacterium]|nr:hypothetical protein [Candidatus Saccharimonadales bacterium]
SEKVFFNTKGDDQIWVSIDILTREVIDQIVAQGQDPGMAVMNDMHITPGRAYLDAPWSPPTSDIDIDAMAPGCHLRFPRNERYDYNTVIVHRVVGGQYVHKSYPIGMIYFRRQSFVL